MVLLLTVLGEKQPECGCRLTLAFLYDGDGKQCTDVRWIGLSSCVPRIDRTVANGFKKERSLPEDLYRSDQDRLSQHRRKLCQRAASSLRIASQL